jgi:hypothetical protein
MRDVYRAASEGLRIFGGATQFDATGRRPPTTAIGNIRHKKSRARSRIDLWSRAPVKDERALPACRRGSEKCVGSCFVAGWSSLVARKAHNLEVVGSNSTPATNDRKVGLSKAVAHYALAITPSGIEKVSFK